MRLINKTFLVLAIGLTLLSGCQSLSDKPQKKLPRFEKQVSREKILSQQHTPVYSYEIVATYPHNPSSYTEGLLVNDGYLYESTGLYGESKILKTELAAGNVVAQIKL